MSDGFPLTRIPRFATNYHMSKINPEKATSVRINKQLHSLLRAKGKREGRSVTYLLNAAVAEYLKAKA